MGLLSPMGMSHSMTWKYKHTLVGCGSVWCAVGPADCGHGHMCLWSPQRSVFCMDTKETGAEAGNTAL